MPQYKSLIGNRYGKLTVIAREPEKKTRHIYYSCKCDCGRMTSVRGDKLENGQAISCGCARRRRSEAYIEPEERRLYNVYISMRQRCNNPNVKEYPNYGGRGISVCEEWNKSRGFTAFREWAMANGYNPAAEYGECTLDRIDVNKSYSPENCRWIPTSRQGTNTTRNIIIEYNNEKHCLKDWSKITGISYAALMKRKKNGWPVEELLGFKERTEKK